MSYEDYKSYTFENKVWNFSKHLDLKITKGTSTQLTLPIQVTSGSTFDFYSNESLNVLSMNTSSGVTLGDTTTIDLTQEQTNKFQSGILALSVKDNGLNYQYLLGEVLNRF